MELLQFVPNFMLVLCRITAFFVVAPILSAKNVPNHFKIGLSVFLALLVVPTMNVTPVPLDGVYPLSIIKETLVGLILGFIAYLYFTIFQIAGSFADMQIGFSMANVIDPLTGVQSPVLGNLKFMIASLLFLAMNGHHALISGILSSYQWIPLNNDVFSQIYNGHVSEFLLHSLSSAFLLAFQLAAPLVVSLFLVDVGLGILARTAPQFNIFVVGIPIKLLVGLMLLLVFVSSFSTLFSSLFTELFREMQKMVEILSGVQTSGQS
ncbi:flagellar biosynthetic protein FliR [Gorillibacterium massiliense]|uniref:flagellar biosynthetic protein FliR n=1 Tax=Gorillibacterium massiliense TaxID=1280390 RepID=UPI0005933717|nr:flagellar biosynthetic protein FliR [Gorillibacterium massiliense]